MKLFAMVDAPDSFGVRAAEPGDYGFICSTLAKLVRERGVRMSHGAIDIVAHRMPVKVACSPRVESTLYGWAIGERGIVVAAYVSFALRGFGIGKALIGEL